MGLRYDYFNAFVPAQHLDAGPFVPARNYDQVDCVPCWNDFGAAPGRGVRPVRQRTDGGQGQPRPIRAGGHLHMARNNNPVQTSVNNASRTWGDANGNFVPDCNLSSPLANGECGRHQQPQLRQHESGRHDLRERRDRRAWTSKLQLATGRERSAGARARRGAHGRILSDLVRRLHGAAEYGAGQRQSFSPYCITAPPDPRLPGGGGNSLCGLYDVIPTQLRPSHQRHLPGQQLRRSRPRSSTGWTSR